MCSRSPQADKEEVLSDKQEGKKKKGKKPSTALMTVDQTMSRINDFVRAEVEEQQKASDDPTSPDPNSNEPLPDLPERQPLTEEELEKSKQEVEEFISACVGIGYNMTPLDLSNLRERDDFGRVIGTGFLRGFPVNAVIPWANPAGTGLADSMMANAIQAGVLNVIDTIVGMDIHPEQRVWSDGNNLDQALIDKIARYIPAPLSLSCSRSAHSLTSHLPPPNPLRLFVRIPWAEETYLFGKHAIDAVRKHSTIMEDVGKSYGMAKDHYVFVTENGTRFNHHCAHNTRLSHTFLSGALQAMSSSALFIRRIYCRAGLALQRPVCRRHSLTLMLRGAPCVSRTAMGPSRRFRFHGGWRARQRA